MWQRAVRRDRRALRAVTVALALTAVLWPGPAPALQAQEDPNDFEAHYDPIEGPPGTVITISGHCRRYGQPGERVLVNLYDEPPTREYATIRLPVGSDGSFGGEMQVPTSAPVGTYRISGSCFKEDYGVGLPVNAPFRVTDPVVVTTTPPTEPPTTTPPTEPPTTTAAPTTTATTIPPTSSTTSATVPATITGPPTTDVASDAPPDPNDEGGTSVAIPALAGAAALAVAGGAAWRLRRSR